jgi:polyketide biosynthesis acyl carrier protein
VKVLPELDPSSILKERTLSELGANSIDRMEIVIKSMETLKVRVPPQELAQVRNIEGLVRLLHAKSGAERS